MRLSLSRPAFLRRRKRYFCNEPWLGILTVETDQEVTFCPCYLKMPLGNLREQSLEELWNAPQLVQIRRDFKKGRLPSACQGQLCPPALGVDGYLSRVPSDT